MKSSRHSRPLSVSRTFSFLGALKPKSESTLRFLLSSRILSHSFLHFSCLNAPEPIRRAHLGAQRAKLGMVTKPAAVSHSLSSSWMSISKWIANISINQAPIQGARLRQPSTARPYHAAVWPSYGITTPVPDQPFLSPKSPFRFETGYALCAKRPSRPFPPPFLSPPSSSFSDPLTTHGLSQDKRLSVKGELVRGLNNGDDAIIVAENFIGVDDGVGAWATKPRGHAA